MKPALVFILILSAFIFYSPLSTAQIEDDTGPVMILEGHSGEVTSVTFSPPWYDITEETIGKCRENFGTRDMDFMKEYLNRKLTRIELRNILSEQGFTDEEIRVVEEITFNPGKGFLTSGSMDATVKLWDIEKGREICSLISLDQGDWAVVTPEGFFDGTPRGMQLIRWRINEELFLMEQFFNDFYHPGLLSDIYGEEKPKIFPEILKERGDIRAGLNIADLDRRLPSVTLEGPSETLTPAVTISVTVAEAPPDKEFSDKGSGVKDVRLFRNGILVKYWPENQVSGSVLTCEVPVCEGKNEFIAYAFNNSNVKSRDSGPLVITGDESLKREPKAYIVAIGIEKYLCPLIQDLTYAVDDAESLAEKLKSEMPVAGENIEIIRCYDDKATKENIMFALKDVIDKAGPEDTVVIIYSGHGINEKIGNENRFFLITHDLGAGGKRDENEFIKKGVSDLDLEALLVGNGNVLKEIFPGTASEEFRALQAQNIALILDCCHSGQALESEEWRVGPMNSRGLAQLAWEKGMEILTASQSDQFAQEAKELGHGVLTYALLEGFINAPYEDNSRLLARTWLDYAAEEVPEIVENNIAFKGLTFSSNLEEIEEKTIQIQTPEVFHKREGGGDWSVAERLSE